MSELSTSERVRFGTQCDRILALLEQGEVSNRQMQLIAYNYTARISQLRQAGHNVQIVKRDRNAGVTWYALMGDDDE